VYLLDTNTIGDLARNPAGKAADRLAATGDELVATSIIVSCEVEYGLEQKGSAKLRQRTEAILGKLAVLGFDRPAHVFYGALRAKLKRLGTPIGPNDLLIAAHALALDATLVTDNEREFSRVPGLKIENWLR
jgi:tRNA(fMet)-specific endonuclease VapC